jgi:hypothetical protein
MTIQAALKEEKDKFLFEDTTGSYTYSSSAETCPLTVF